MCVKFVSPQKSKEMEKVEKYHSTVVFCLFSTDYNSLA